MSDERLVNSLAERIYLAHQEWRAMLSEVNQAWVRWFALHEDFKRVYLDIAEGLLASETRR